MKVPWRLILVATVVSTVAIEFLDDEIGVRKARLVVWPFLMLFVIWISSRQWTKEDVKGHWAKTRGLEADGSIAADVERYLRRQQRFNLLGGFLGLSLAWGYSSWSSPPLDWAIGLFLLVPLSTLLLGAQMLAEHTFVPEAGGPVRRAELVPRRLSDYVPPRVIAMLRLLGAATLLIGLAIPVLWPSEDDVTLIVIGLATGGFVIAVELAQRWRTHWPRPFDSAESAHIQDVLRADAIRMAIWGGVMASASAFTAQLIVLARHIDGPAALALPALGAAVMAVLAIGGVRSNLRGFSLRHRRRPVGIG